VYRAIRAQCAEDVEAEDIVQETFLKAFRSISSYRPREGIRFPAWLLKIASTTTHKWAPLVDIVRELAYWAR
jgi:DNA-directed RNA polymerase specialized sigma24 family protein